MKNNKPKKRGRGRPRGSLKKTEHTTEPYLLDVVMTCCKCGRVIVITTQKKNYDLYQERKNTWQCGLC